MTFVMRLVLVLTCFISAVNRLQREVSSNIKVKLLQPYCSAWCGLACARPAVLLGLWSITSSLCGKFYVPRLHKLIKWFADNDVPHRNLTCTVDSRYLAPVGSQNSRAQVKGFCRYLALLCEGPNSWLPGSESHTVTSAPLKPKQYVER